MAVTQSSLSPTIQMLLLFAFKAAKLTDKFNERIKLHFNKIDWKHVNLLDFSLQTTIMKIYRCRELLYKRRRLEPTVIKTFSSASLVNTRSEKMISIAFLLCSTLLLSGVIAAPAETTIDIAKDPIIEYVYNDESVSSNHIFKQFLLHFFFVLLHRSQDPIHIEVGKQAAAASIKVLNDLLDGKDLQNSLLDR